MRFRRNWCGKVCGSCDGIEPISDIQAPRCDADQFAGAATFSAQNRHPTPIINAAGTLRIAAIRYECRNWIRESSFYCSVSENAFTMPSLQATSASCLPAQLSRLTRSRLHNLSTSACVATSSGINTGSSQGSVAVLGGAGIFNPTPDRVLAASPVNDGGSDGLFRTATAHSRNAVVSSSDGAVVSIETASGVMDAAVNCLVLSEFQINKATATTSGTRTEPTTLPSISALSQ